MGLPWTEGLIGSGFSALKPSKWGPSVTLPGANVCVGETDHKQVNDINYMGCPVSV